VDFRSGSRTLIASEEKPDKSIVSLTKDHSLEQKWVTDAHERVESKIAEKRRDLSMALRLK